MCLDGVAGFVEEPTFYPYLSGRVNLELYAELDGGGATGRVEEVLEQVGLAGRGGDRVSGYSTGMRQRLGIAAALLRSPRLLLLDEPTSGLDPAGARDMGRLVRRLAGDGTAVLLSSHLIGDLENVCDSFTVLRLGRVVWNGSGAAAARPGPGVGVPAGDERRRPRARDRRAASERARDDVADRGTAARGAGRGSTPTCSTSGAPR